MFVLICASLIATSFASLPVLEFKDGGCPNFSPSANFQPNQIFGTYYILATSEAGPPQENCCKCGEITYTQGTGKQIKSERRVYTLSGVPKVTQGQYNYIESGRFNYLYLDNGDFKDTHMTITFNVHDQYLVVYGCIPKEGRHADVVLFLSRDRNAQVTPDVKQLVAHTGLTQFNDVNQENCS